VLWIPDKEALISDVVKVDRSSRATTHRSLSRGRNTANSRSRSHGDRCCGASPGHYGHQL